MLFLSRARAAARICSLSLHDALPIWHVRLRGREAERTWLFRAAVRTMDSPDRARGQVPSPVDTWPRARSGESMRSEGQTSELQSHSALVRRLLLEKKKQTRRRATARR